MVWVSLGQSFLGNQLKLIASNDESHLSLGCFCSISGPPPKGKIKPVFVLNIKPAVFLTTTENFQCLEKGSVLMASSFWGPFCRGSLLEHWISAETQETICEPVAQIQFRWHWGVSIKLAGTSKRKDFAALNNGVSVKLMFLIAVQGLIYIPVIRPWWNVSKHAQNLEKGKSANDKAPWLHITERTFSLWGTQMLLKVKLLLSLKIRISQTVIQAK